MIYPINAHAEPLQAARDRHGRSLAAEVRKLLALDTLPFDTSPRHVGQGGFRSACWAFRLRSQDTINLARHSNASGLTLGDILARCVEHLGA